MDAQNKWRWGHRCSETRSFGGSMLSCRAAPGEGAGWGHSPCSGWQRPLQRLSAKQMPNATFAFCLFFFFFFHKSKNFLQIYFGERKRVVMYVSLKGEVVKTKFWKEGGTYARQYVAEKNAFLPNSSLLNTDELYMRRQLKNVFLTSVSIWTVLSVDERLTSFPFSKMVLVCSASNQRPVSREILRTSQVHGGQLPWRSHPPMICSSHHFT